MVVRAERVVEIPAPRERVWKFIDDPEKRARPISVVDDFELLDDGKAIWHISLPLPLTDRTMKIETKETKRIPPESVEFDGRSRALTVRGIHELEEITDRTKLSNTFIVESRVPGVERFFEKNIDSEIDNLEAAIWEDLELKTD